MAAVHREGRGRVQWLQYIRIGRVEGGFDTRGAYSLEVLNQQLLRR